MRRAKAHHEILHYNIRQQLIYAAKTGIFVNIQNIGKNTRTIAVPVKKSIQEVFPGVFLSSGTIKLGKKDFTNIYNLSWNPSNKKLAALVYSEKRPYYLLDYVERDPSVLAVINGSYFFLVDEHYQEPKEYAFNFCVRDGSIVGLPSSNDPIIYVCDGELRTYEPEARGIIDINGRKIRWYGSENGGHKDPQDSTLYNTASAKLIKTFDLQTGVRRASVDINCIHTPQNNGVVDLVINEDAHGMLRVTAINPQGGTHYFEGLFILQVPASNHQFNIGDSVKPLMLDGLNLQRVSSGITVGKSVRDPYFFVPERINSRDARSILAKDVWGNIQFIVFDGSKYIPHFNGVSAYDISDYFSPDKFEWAYFLDGGSSSRIIARDGKKLRFYANEFAFRKYTMDTFIWDWKRHRKLASSFVLKVKAP